LPATFDTWTVLDHQPISKVAENLWIVEGKLGTVQRRMALARLADGRILVHNGIALRDEEMAEIDAWGTVAAIIVPNGYHRQDARIYKQWYPAAKVYCPTGATGRVAKVVAVDGNYDAVPQDASVRVFHLEGTAEREGAVEVHHGDRVSLVLNDAVMNVPKTGFPMGFFLSPTGIPAVPRVFRWFAVKDAAKLRGHLERLADQPGLERVVMSHGRIFSDAPRDQLRAAATTC
jgi:hypothetical protein